MSARERRAFLRALTVTPQAGQVVIGVCRDLRGNWSFVGMETKRLVGLHAAIAGGTNSGKSSWLFGVLAQVIMQDRCCVIVYDAKGETADMILDVMVPYLLELGVGENLLSRLRVVRVFDRRYVPLLNLTRAEHGGVPKEAQAYGVASAIEQALAEPLGGRMHHVLVRCVSLCIELGWPLTRVQEWLATPAAFHRDAARSTDAALHEYARTGFRQENKESLRALGSRLNALLFWPDARLALCAPGAISFSDALAQPGLTVIHTGSPPAGAERLARFFGAALLGQVVRALLSREVGAETAPALFVTEEIQENLGVEEARQLGRILATARFKSAAVWIVTQSRSLLHSVDPGLVAAMRTNVDLHVQFRTSPEDAAAFAHLLPKEREGEAARRELIDSLTRLPQRHCYLAVRDLGLKAQPVLAPRIDFESLRACGGRITPELSRRIHQGIAALPRDEALRLMASLDKDNAVANPGDSLPVAPPTEDQFPVLG